MQRQPLLLVTLLGLATVFAHAAESAAERYQMTADRFVQTHFERRPLEAVALGWHQYDGQYVVWDRTAIAAEQQRLHRFADQFATLPAAELTADQRRDLQMLRNAVAKELWGFERIRQFQRNPMTYAGALDVSIYLKRDFKPLADRTRDMTAILKHAPAVFDAAREQLEPSLPRPYITTAIEVAEGTAAFLEGDVTRAVQAITNTPVVGEFGIASRRAVAELRGYAKWLKEEKLPRASDQYAIGPAAFAEMLRGDMIGLDPDQVLAVGLRELKAEQQRFTEAARIIDPARPAPEIFRAIQQDHPTEQSLLPDTRRNLEAIRQFVLDRQLVSIPSPVRARVEETLPPFRATSFASMDTPGPFETKATEAYYYVTPTEPEWTPAQKDEWLTAFNYYTTDVVSIHEAYPGHYVQYLALNASKASPIAKIFGSYSFSEGWAHYTEQMVIDAGFPIAANPAAPTREETVRAAKYRLAQSSEALLRLCRLCVAVKLHCHGMSVDEGTRFFVENSYYEQKPARSEATRGTFDPGYCFYTLGKLQLLKLRHDLQKQEGAAFNLQRFHDRVLSFGSPPVQLLREELIADPARRADAL